MSLNRDNAKRFVSDKPRYTLICNIDTIENNSSIQDSVKEEKKKPNEKKLNQVFTSSDLSACRSKNDWKRGHTVIEGKFLYIYTTYSVLTFLSPDYI